ncbi:unnamed protein product, partial [Lampetra planeri]
MERGRNEEKGNERWEQAWKSKDNQRASGGQLEDGVSGRREREADEGGEEHSGRGENVALQRD